MLEIGSRHQKSRSQKTSACLCGSIVASCGIQGSTISSYTATHGSVRILAWLQSLHGMWQMEQIFSFLKVTAPWPCHSCTRVLSLWTKIFLLALTNKLMLRYGSSRQYVPTNKAEMPWPQQRENLRLCLAVNQKILNLDNRNMLLNTSQCFTEPKPFCVFLSHSLYTPKIAQPFN